MFSWGIGREMLHEMGYRKKSKILDNGKSSGKGTLKYLRSILYVSEKLVTNVFLVFHFLLLFRSSRSS